MDFVRYFIEPNVPFGGVSTAMALVWAVALGVGVYLLRSYRDNHQVRTRFVQRAALIASVLSGVGLVLLVLKFLNVPVVEWRLWSWLVALAWLGYLGYTIYFYNSRLPVQIATSRPMRTVRSQAGRHTARMYAAGGDGASTPKPPREPRPVATTTRRDARRDKKRKSR